jgi:hypothetical protein
MRKFIEDNGHRKLSDNEFNNWLNYLEEYANFIVEKRKSPKIQEKASLSLELDSSNEDISLEYELFVKLNQIVKDNQVIFLIDLDYSHFEIIE